MVAGGIKAGFEADDYANGKSRDNLLKSTKEVGYSFFSAGATTGMTILPVIGLGATVDWAKDSGNYDIVKITGSNIKDFGPQNAVIKIPNGIRGYVMNSLLSNYCHCNSGIRAICFVRCNVIRYV